MGRGRHTSQDNVSKSATSYGADQSTVAGSESGGYDKESAGICLITFRVHIATSPVNVGDTFVLLYGDDALQLVSKGKQIGLYKGSRLQMLKQCIAGGYTYHGRIDSKKRDGSKVISVCTITGKGPV